MKKLLHFTLLSFLILTITSCANFEKREDQVPGYKITVVQGNELTAEQFSQLHVGMSKEEVKNLLGEPQLENPFRDDTWHYLYTVLKANKFKRESQLIVKFNGDTVSDISGQFEAFDYADETYKKKNK